MDEVLNNLGVAAIALAWLVALFAMLQAFSGGRRVAAGAGLAAALLGAALVATRTSVISLEWLRSPTLRSDAIAISALVPAIAAVAVAAVSGIRWLALAAGAICTVAGFAAFGIARGTMHWDETALLAGPILAAAEGLRPLLAHWLRSPDRPGRRSRPKAPAKPARNDSDAPQGRDINAVPTPHPTSVAIAIIAGAFVLLICATALVLAAPDSSPRVETSHSRHARS